MQIIVEQGRIDGNLKSMVIHCTHFFGQDNIRIRDEYEQDVIQCIVTKKTKMIAYFGSTKQRNEALEALKKRSSDTVILDYNKYFCYEAYEDVDALHILRNEFRNFSLQKHLQLQCERKLNEPYEVTDAFKDLGILFVTAMFQSKEYYIEEEDKYSELWAKCLWCPQIVKLKGISPRQYFKYLIIKNNEKFLSVANLSTI